jgi:hypothetical protein
MFITLFTKRTTSAFRTTWILSTLAHYFPQIHFSIILHTSMFLYPCALNVLPILSFLDLITLFTIWKSQRKVDINLNLKKNSNFYGPFRALHFSSHNFNQQRCTLLSFNSVPWITAIYPRAAPVYTYIQSTLRKPTSSCTHATHQNIVQYTFQPITITELPGDGPESSENCRSLIF